MGRFDHVVRVVRLVQLLGEKRAGVPVRGIADALGVTERTAYRYLEALEREQPDYLITGEREIARYDYRGALAQRISWDEIGRWVRVDRRLWLRPVALFSLTMLEAADGRDLRIDGITGQTFTFTAGAGEVRASATAPVELTSTRRVVADMASLLDDSFSVRFVSYHYSLALPVRRHRSAAGGPGPGAWESAGDEHLPRAAPRGARAGPTGSPPLDQPTEAPGHEGSRRTEPNRSHRRE